MPPKYNRNRNTITVSGGGQFLKSGFSGFNRQNNSAVQRFSDSQKNYLNLKLLEKCEEKIFEFKENKYIEGMKNQQGTNQILAILKPQTMNQARMQGLKGSDRFLELNRSARKRNSDCLISSWTALVNLDITYKIRETDLLKQNRALHNKLAIMEGKLKGLYSQKYTDSQKNKNQNQNKLPTAALTYANMQHIQRRIDQHQMLISKLKEKMEKKQQEQIQINQLLERLIQKCRLKYGQQVMEKLHQMFRKQ